MDADAAHNLHGRGFLVRFLKECIGRTTTLALWNQFIS
jgi:hypothetical protein